jgi:hypothetical protein
MFDLRTIARARAVPIESVIDTHGIRLRGRIERVGPCPVCHWTDRFAVNVKKQLFNCRGCSTKGDAIALEQHITGCDFRTAVESLSGGAWRPSAAAGSIAAAVPPKPLPRPAPPRDDSNLATALSLWRRREPIAGTIGEAYLRQARGYAGPLPATLGFLLASAQYPPAMIAAFSLANEPECGAIEISDSAVRAVHPTRLATDGSGRTGKIMLGRNAVGAPIVLAPPNDLLGLAICEGIEDALSVHEATGLGAWAAGAANRMPALADTVPACVECVTVIADDNQVGRDYATALASRLKARGFGVVLKVLGVAR